MEPLATDTEDGRGRSGTVLVLEPPMDSRAETTALDALPPAPDEWNVLAVLFTTTPTAYLEQWERHAGDTPNRTALVSVGGGASGPARPATDTRFESTDVESITSPSDLTGIGIAISNALGAWADGDRDVLVDVRSLTTLLQYVEIDLAFKFLHQVSSRVRAADGRAYYHITPGAHDERTLHVIAQAADSVVEAGDVDSDATPWQQRP